MNTNIVNKIYIDYIDKIKESNYEFKCFDKSLLEHNASVIKMSMNGEYYSEWADVSTLMFHKVREILPAHQYDIDAFMVSPSWKENNRIVRYYGLKRALAKNYKGLDSSTDISDLDFLFEKSLIKNNHIIFYGVIEVNQENARQIFNHLSYFENGVLLAYPIKSSLDLIIEELSHLVYILKIDHFRLNIIQLIDLILAQKMIAILPYAWDETGSYHLDIFMNNVSIK